MGVCCQNPQSQVEDRVVVVNIFKDFDKETKYLPLIRQAKTENAQVITIKQLTNNQLELNPDALMKMSETINRSHTAIDHLMSESSVPIQLKNDNSFVKTTENQSNTAEIHSKRKKKMKLKDHQISKDEQSQIKKIFHRLFLFDVFPESALDILLSNLLLLEITAESYLYKKGFQSQFFYIVLEGTLEVYKDNQLTKLYHQWDSFGHSSLISNNHVIHLDESVKCIAPTKLFVLNGEIFLSIKQKIIEFVMQERYDFINTIIFFKTLDSIAKHSIAERMKQVSFNENDVIISKGDQGNNIYMIKEGSVSCQVKSVEVKHLGVSRYFGIISLLQKCNRTLDVIAKEKCVCFELTCSDLSEAIGSNYIETMLLSIFKEYLFKNAYFKDLINEENTYELFTHFTLKSYRKNETIFSHSAFINNSDSNKRIIIVIEGNLLNEKTREIEYKSGGVIGEEIVKNYIDIPNNLVAYPDCLTLETNVDLIPHLLGEEFKANTISIMTKVYQLQQLHLFFYCPEGMLKQIVFDIEKEKYMPEQVIIKENAPGDVFYIIVKGRVEVSINNKRIRLLEDDSFFGEMACLDQSPAPKYSATVKALTEVNCVKVHKAEFDLIIKDQGVNDLIRRRSLLHNNTIQLSELKLIKHVGNGKFGSVDLVHNNHSMYAIKAIIRKDADAKMRMATYLLEERRILLSVDHPFIGKIVKTFQSEYYVFLLLEYINGQNLRQFLDSHPSVLHSDDVRFYIACLLLVIDYLNKKKIVHRDIKLNNLILESTGYVKLIDFGTAKTLNDYTHTIIGTPHYMSPEVLKGKGYSFSGDYWSIGICAYELFFKKYPFGNEATDVIEIYNEIIYSEYRFPFVNEESNAFTEFINAILQKQITRRICSLSKFKQLKLFEGMEWNDLLHFKTPSPYKPSFIDFSDIDYKIFKSPYEDYINRDMYLSSNQNGNYKETSKGKSDFLWAKEFNM